MAYADWNDDLYRGSQMNVVSEFNLQKVKCAGCIGKIESALNKIDGIKNAKVNLLEKMLFVEYKTANLDQEVIKAVTNLGFGASTEKQPDLIHNLWKDVGLPLFLGVMLMILGMSYMPDYITNSGFIFGIIEAILTIIVITLTGKSIFSSGLNGFRTLNFNMHSLIILGVGSAWIYSLWVILIIHSSSSEIINHVYFESSLIIIGLINLGAFFEERAKASTTTAIKALVGLQPNETTILINGEEQTINTNLLRTENIVKIRPGFRIPADGVIIDGESFVDESMLSGEPLAINKKPGDKVIAGSINTNGVFIFSVTAIGSNTVLAEIIQLVKSAQMSKPPLAKLADKVAKVFVPAVIVIAACSAILWLTFGPTPKIFYSVSVFMTVLIIACPCSVGLAIPVALMVGLGRSATKGILIRDASCLNIISKLDYVLVDKTGTITSGKPEVVDFVTTIEANKYLELAKALESNSEHPLAHAVLTYKPTVVSTYKVTDFAMVSGGGISGIIDGTKYFLGSSNWLSNIVKSPNTLDDQNNHTRIFLADENQVLARLDISDTIKPDSILAIEKLHNMGIKVAMVTGDNEDNAMHIAGLVKIDQVYANKKPGDKIKVVQELQAKGQKVAFVGDGINDAPSLAQANVGIAIGNGSDIAMNSANITLMKNSLLGISDAITIGQKINKNMYQNLFGSFIYNSAAVIIAAGALYPIWHILLNPIIASIAMSLSSITVIFNALRLRRI